MQCTLTISEIHNIKTFASWNGFSKSIRKSKIKGNSKQIKYTKKELGQVITKAKQICSGDLLPAEI